jgi:hypothetical protein
MRPPQKIAARTPKRADFVCGAAKKLSSGTKSYRNAHENQVFVLDASSQVR